MLTSTGRQFYHPVTPDMRTLLAQDALELISRVPTDNFESPPPKHSGKPARKARVDWLDIVAVAVSMLCLTTAVLVIDPAYSYAARLRSSGQIIALGFLLGVMNQCLQRILPYLFILLEGRYGTSTLQNYEGLLRWSPFTSKLGFIWRSALILLLIFPLVLSVLYKQFTGGWALQPPETLDADCTLTGPPGMQGNVGYITLFANTTAPFLFQTRDGFNNPSAQFFDEPHLYGFNTILLSNTTAAVLDAPLPSHMFSIQQNLLPGSTTNLTADVRATIVEYNSTVDDHRGDTEYWQTYYNMSGYDQVYVWGLGDGLQYGIMQNSSPAYGTVWDGSWIYVSTLDPDSMSTTFDSFTRFALRFDVRRHQCRATWQVTRSSVQLVSGYCHKEPLDTVFQSYSQAQLGIIPVFSQALVENLGSFTRIRKGSPWLIPTHTMVIASMYHTLFAAKNATIKVQQDGSFAAAWNLTLTRTGNTYYTEIYSSRMTLEGRVPALRATIGLYFIIAIQPFLTILAYFASFTMYSVPIGRTFGLVSIMAGIDRTTLDLIMGAGFSGELHKPIGLSINAVPSIAPQSLAGKNGPLNGYAPTQEKIEYRIGEVGVKGKLRPRRIYW